MSAPNDYGQQPGFQPYGQQPPFPDDGLAPVGTPPPGAPQAHGEAAGGKKKKRAYAAQAFDVGSGANAAVGGQLPGGGQFGTPQPAAAGYGYPGQEAQPAVGAAAYGAPQTYGSPGAAPGFQPPDAYGAPPAPGVAGITQGMAGMQMGQGQPAPQQVPPQACVGPLNQLYPTDLLNQPFNVSELDLPPPPIILPPNVSTRGFPTSLRSLTRNIVQLYSFPGCELPTKICAIHPQCRAHDALSPQEIEAALRPRHTAVRLAARYGRPRPCCPRPGHFALPEMSVLHQPICHIPRPRTQMAV